MVSRRAVRYGNASVAQVLLAQAAQQVARPRPPQADAAIRRRDVLHAGGAVIRNVRFDPAEVVETHGPACDHQEALLLQACHRQVALDAAPGREHGGVGDGADGPVHLVGGEALQRLQGARPRHLELGEGGQVEEGHPLPGGHVLGGHDRRPLHGLPAGPHLTRHLQGVEEARVRLVPLGPLPSRALEEPGPQLALPRVERRQPQVPGAGDLLARVDDVVDLAVLLRRPGPHVGPRLRVRVEAPDVALPQVHPRLAVDQPLRHRLADAPGVGDPHRLGRPEAGHPGGLAEDGETVGGEGEQAVEAAGSAPPPSGRGADSPAAARPFSKCRGVKGISAGGVEVSPWAGMSPASTRSGSCW